MEKRTCRNCNTGFTVEDGDIAFLKKMGEQDFIPHEIPPPTLCPACRQMRRMTWRNERYLYRRKCDITGQNIISMFPPDSPFKVCHKDYWYSHQFQPLNYGRDYDFSRPFFDQFYDLMKVVPFPSLRVERSENCDYNSGVGGCKDCYMCSRTHACNNVLYTYRGNGSNDCTDCTQVVDSNFLYDCTECVNCYNSKYLSFCSHCSESAFLYDCRNCRDCFMSVNLRNKQYVFMNEQLTKEAYEKKLATFDFGSRHMMEKARERFATIRKNAIRRHLTILNSEDCTGDNIVDCKNCYLCFGVKFVEDGRYLWDMMKFKDSMDVYTGGRFAELVYESTSIAAAYNIKFCLRATSTNAIYCFFVNACENTFGCIGLSNLKFCILNKQYTESEYRALLPKIIEHMKSTGEYGEFFPVEKSLFAYNESTAQDFFPLSKEQALAKGYRWHENDPREYKPQHYRAPDNIDEVGDDLLSEALACTQCGKNYKVVPQELRFYKQHRVPVPDLCYDCRYDQRLKLENPLKLRLDVCAKCGKQVMTSFAKGTANIYCDPCYTAALN